MERRRDNPDDPILRENYRTTQEFAIRAMEHDARRAAADDEDFRSPLWNNALRFAGHNPTSPTLDTIIKARSDSPYRVSLVKVFEALKAYFDSHKFVCNSYNIFVRARSLLLLKRAHQMI
jgi:hypothetical protein